MKNFKPLCLVLALLSYGLSLGTQQVTATETRPMLTPETEASNPNYVTITVHYLDEAGHPLHTSTQLHIYGPQDSETQATHFTYATTALTFEGYELVNVPHNAAGETQQDLTVTYIYRQQQHPPQANPISFTITVNYLNEAGTPLHPATSQEVWGTLDEQGQATGFDYQTSPLTLMNYQLLHTPNNAQGQAKSDTAVNYIYRPLPNPSTTATHLFLTRHFVDEKGQTLLPSKRERLGNPNGDYIATPAVIEGYELMGMPSNASGRTEKDISVTFVYRKKKLSRTTTSATSTAEAQPSSTEATPSSENKATQATTHTSETTSAAGRTNTSNTPSKAHQDKLPASGEKPSYFTWIGSLLLLGLIIPYTPIKDGANKSSHPL